MQLLVHSNTKASHWRNCWMDDDDLDELYEDVVDSQGSSTGCKMWMSKKKKLRLQVIQNMCDQSCLLVDLSCGNSQNIYIYIYICIYYICILCILMLIYYIHTYSPSMKFLLMCKKTIP